MEMLSAVSGIDLSFNTGNSRVNDRTLAHGTVHLDPAIMGIDNGFHIT